MKRIYTNPDHSGCGLQVNVGDATPLGYPDASSVMNGLWYIFAGHV